MCVSEYVFPTGWSLLDQVSITTIFRPEMYARFVLYDTIIIMVQRGRWDRRIVSVGQGGHVFDPTTLLFEEFRSKRASLCSISRWLFCQG